METAKIQVKLQQGDRVAWSHFCYVPVDVKERFDDQVNNQGFLNNYWLRKWAYEDFELMEVDTPEGMTQLKDAIKTKYKERYPELYWDSATDKQGWLRVWYTEHMEEELKNVGR